MDDVEAFRAELLARVHARASADSNFHHSSFAQIAADLLEESEEIFDFDTCYYRGKGARNRNLAIDGYAFDDADGSLRLVIAVYSGEPEATVLTKTEARSSFSALVAFVEDAIKGLVEQATDESSPEHGLALDIRARSANLSRYRCYLVTDHVLSEKVKDWPEGEIAGLPVDFHIWDCSRFLRAHQSRSGRDELVVDFGEVAEGGLPCLPACVNAGSYEAYLCVIPGTVLADIYELYGSRLLEGNVRSFLSTTVSVNRGIQQTLHKEPRMFFAFNNGISATASSIEIRNSDRGPRITAATNFQIVNGGQTTASLAYARRKETADLTSVFVQMKLSVVGEEDAGTLIPFISRYSNSQNKISDADFFSNHEFHRAIEKVSRRLRAPAKGGSQIESFWFYERARGQYAVEIGRLTGTRKRQFELETPREQIITKTDLAKVENSWRCLPHEVSRGAQKNFLRFAESISKEWEQDPTRFHDEFFRCEVAKTIIFRTLEKQVPKEPWYNGGYRANIVTYSIAKLADMIAGEAKGRRLDFDIVWKKQAVPQGLVDQLSLIAAAAYDVLITPEAGIQNVTEWAKKELAWKRLKARHVEWLPSVNDLLIEPDVVANRNRTARANAKVDSAVDALKEVLAYGPTKWEQLRTNAVAARAVTDDEERLLRVATNPKWLASDQQAKKLMRLKQKLIDEGIKAD